MKSVFKKIWKGIVWLWRKVFPKKIVAIKPSGSSSLIAGQTNGIEFPNSFKYKAYRHFRTKHSEEGKWFE